MILGPGNNSIMMLPDWCDFNGNEIVFVAGSSACQCNVEMCL